MKKIVSIFVFLLFGTSFVSAELFKIVGTNKYLKVSIDEHAEAVVTLVHDQRDATDLDLKPVRHLGYFDHNYRRVLEVASALSEELIGNSFILGCDAQGIFFVKKYPNSNRAYLPEAITSSGVEVLADMLWDKNCVHSFYKAVRLEEYYMPMGMPDLGIDD